MSKVKEKIALMLSLVGIVRVTGPCAISDMSSSDTHKKAVQTKLEIVKSFISTTDGQPARNSSNI